MSPLISIRYMWHICQWESPAWVWHVKCSIILIHRTTERERWNCMSTLCNMRLKTKKIEGKRYFQTGNHTRKQIQYETTSTLRTDSQAIDDGQIWGRVRLPLSAIYWTQEYIRKGNRPPPAVIESGSEPITVLSPSLSLRNHPRPVSLARGQRCASPRARERRNSVITCQWPACRTEQWTRGKLRWGKERRRVSWIGEEKVQVWKPPCPKSENRRKTLSLHWRKVSQTSGTTISERKTKMNSKLTVTLLNSHNTKQLIDHLIESLQKKLHKFFDRTISCISCKLCSMRKSPYAIFMYIVFCVVNKCF